MPFGACWIAESDLWRAAGLLARWFRFQPSEIDDLTVDEFKRWVEVASEQISESAR
jgi:hypothetical protein